MKVRYVSMYKLVGYQHQDLTFKDGRSISGWKLHCTEPRNGVNGFAVDSFFLSDQKAGSYEPKVGDVLEVIWNRWGKIDGIRLNKQ